MFSARFKRRLVILALPLSLTATLTVVGSGVSGAEEKPCESVALSALPLSLCRLTD